MKSDYNSLTELANKIQADEELKEDFIVSQGALEMREDDFLHIDKGKGEYEINDHCHRQIAKKLQIPKKYYDAMSAVPGLRTHNVNTWLNHAPGKKRLVRLLDGKARAFLSDKYRPLDNILLMSAFLPAIQDLQKKGVDFKGIEVKAGLLTEKRMYLQCTFPGMEAKVKKGDPVKWGIMLTNSEVGASAVDVKSLIWRLVCDNGMIGESLMRRYHSGSRLTDMEDQIDIFQHDTIRAELKSFRLKLRDIIKDALNPAHFEAYVKKLQVATTYSVDKPVKTVENVTRRFDINQAYIEPIVSNMAKENNMNKYGVANGISFMAHEIENQDQAYDLEKISSRIIDLSPAEWESVAA